MAELTINGVKYSNINNSQSVISNTFKNARTHFVTSDKIDTTKITNIFNAVAQGSTEWGNMAFINGLEIDWNGAGCQVYQELPYQQKL